MITNYTPDGCRYSIGKLVNAVYLVSENALKDIRIDNGNAYINSISESPIKLDCYGINLSEEESLDERYKFIHTLKFLVNGYANKDDFQGRYYVIVKDEEGTYWFVNPLFPVKVTYTYTLGYQQNHTDFSIATASNHPVLRLYGMSDTDAHECEGYLLDGIDALWLNEKKYTVHNGNSVKYTNGGFKTIEYNKSSAVFTETFDGENTKHQIDFDVLFSQYKSSWHYNLLEFKDNLYSAVFKTTNGKYALCGFSFGLQPSYTVSADDTIQNVDKIQITLQDAHDVGDAIAFYDYIDYEYLPDKTWEYTSEYDGYECVGEGIAKYLLQKEVDALGNETGNYKALEGYENDFQELNVVDTFDSVMTFARSECSLEPCRLSTSLPRRIKFTSVGSKIYTLRAGSDWTIIHDQGISVSPDNGVANVDYTITVYNGHTPTSEAWLTNLKVTYCDGMEHNSVIEVVVDEDACFENGSTYNISANEQTLTIPTQCCIQSIKERTGVGTISNVYSTYITVYVPVNSSGINRTAILLVELCDGSATNITINQSNLFESWVDDHTICIGRSKYMVQYKYTGTSPDHCDTRTDETRTVLVDVTSDDCIYEYRWVLSDQTDCVEYDEYYLYQRQVRIIDGVDPWENVTPAEYSIDGYGTMERVLFKKKSVNCGWVNYAMYRWVDTNDGECFEVKECEDYDQLNVPVNIRDGIVVDNKVSSVYNVSTSTTGRVYSNVAEILLGNDLIFDTQANEVVDANTGLTIGNYVTSNYFTKNVTGRTVVTGSRYQALVGCGIEHINITANKMDGEGTHYSPVYSFVYLLKDTPLNSYVFGGGSADERITVYVQDWAIHELRASYIDGSHPILLPMTDNPVPIVLTEYKTRDAGGYICDGVDKYNAVDVLNSSGTVLANDVKGELIERYSTDCGYIPSKLTVVDSAGTESQYIDCDTGKTITREEVSSSISNRESITSLTINTCVETIGDFCFGGTWNSFTNLINLSLPNGLLTIGNGAFSQCSSLTSIDIPSSVTSIGNQAFEYCTSLTSVTIPSGVTSIGSSAFTDCENLTSMTINANTTEIGRIVMNCWNLEEITFPPSLTAITSPIITDASGGSSKLATVTLPSPVKVQYTGYYRYYPFPYSRRKNLTIYVPAELVQSYENDEYFSIHTITAIQ